MAFPLQILIMLWILLFIQPSDAIGMSIAPTLAGDKGKYSGISNLFKCISYQTVKDDIIMVTIKSGDRLPSQSLNLNVFDSENNKIRFKKDIAHDINLIFTNLNNPTQVGDDGTILDTIKRSNIFKFSHNDKNKGNNDKNKERMMELINSNKGKSLIYICFDNLYSDRSWSFHPQSRDVELFVDIKNMTTIKETNYNNFAQYFNRLRYEEDKRKNIIDDNNNQDSVGIKKQFTEDDFESQVKHLETELDGVVENLQKSESILKSLMEQEYKLRDVNEEIYSGYTKISIVLLLSICLFGIGQIIYFRCYLKKRKVL